MGTVTLRLVESKLMVGTDSNDNSIVIGRSPEDNSKFAGVKASDLLLLAAAACSAYDVVEILRKQRQPLQDLKVLCTGTQQSDPPYAFTGIHLQYIVNGAVESEKLEKAIQLSVTKYCSVIASIRSDIPLTYECEVIG